MTSSVTIDRWGRLSSHARVHVVRRSTTGAFFSRSTTGARKSGVGVLAVFGERDGSVVQLGWYRAPKAHSVAVDPATHRLYLPLADVGGHPVLRVLVPSDSH